MNFMPFPNRANTLFATAVLCALWTLAVLLSGRAEAAPLLQEGKKSLYQRILTRPGAQIYPTADSPTGKPEAGFTAFYVFARQNGRLQVGGTTIGQPKGWIDEAQTVNWPHAMIGAFTNPAGRHRALFLDRASSEEKLLSSSDSAAQSEAMLQTAKEGRIQPPVISIEPENYVDITRSFYLMPVLDAKEIERDEGPSVRSLHILAVPEKPAKSIPKPEQSLKAFKGGLVFVVDTTLSMQPYIERTQKIIREITDEISGSPAGDHFRFGLIGYRDDPKETPGLEYETKLFARPDFSAPAGAINEQIAAVRDARVSSKGFDEDALAGVKKGLDDIDWDSFGGRYMVLITDAGTREHENSSTGLDVTRLNQLARQKGVALYVLHLLTPAGKRNGDHARAAAQYRKLASFTNADPLYYPIEGGTPEAFTRIARNKISNAILKQVSETAGVPGDSSPDAAPELSAREQKQQAVVQEAMRLAWLGRTENTQLPSVIEAWTSDRDPANTSRRTVEIRVLMTRNQLSDLAGVLQKILNQGLADRLKPQDFFSQLQAVFAASARDPAQLAKVSTLGGFLDDYLTGLPYKSTISSITPDDWLSMGAIQQKEILSGIESDLRLYQDYEEHPELWHALAPDAPPGEQVYPVPLDALP